MVSIYPKTHTHRKNICRRSIDLKYPKSNIKKYQCCYHEEVAIQVTATAAVEHRTHRSTSRFPLPSLRWCRRQCRHHHLQCRRHRRLSSKLLNEGAAPASLLLTQV